MKKTMKNVAMGATGLAIAAGAVATGVVLSKKKNRTKLVKGAKKLRTAIEDANQRYQTYQHRIGLNKGKRKAVKRKIA